MSEQSKNKPVIADKKVEDYFFSPDFAPHCTYWTGCRISDKGIFYIFLTVGTICITSIIMLLIFSCITIPIIIDNW